jgi:long-subunit fatty acid transport protein
VNYRISPEIEVGANYTLPITVHAKGDATAMNGPAVNIGGAAVLVVPKADDAALCEKGGTPDKLKGCADFELPMTAQVGGRYKFLAPSGKLKGDIELDVGWEKWGTECKYRDSSGALTDCQNPSDFHITVDARVTTTTDPNGGIDLHPTQLAHGFQDVYNARLGGSWVFPIDNGHDIVARGGLSYDSAAAKPGWERVDLDGAARTMIAAGASYKTKRLSIDAGFGFIYEGTRTQNRNCVVTGMVGNEGCGAGGTEQGVAGWSENGPYRVGPDPINPLLPQPDVQAEHPVNEGTYDSSYIVFMLGMNAAF